MSKEIEEANARHAEEMAAKQKQAEKALTQSERITSAIVGCGVIVIIAALAPLLIMLWKLALR